MKTLLIITGWTRGLGEGILQGYANVHGQDLAVIGIARTKNHALAQSLSTKIASFHSISADLSDGNELDHAISTIENCYNELVHSFGEPERRILVNNAAITGPIGTLPAIKSRARFFTQASAAFALNCIAPALISACFLSKICAGHEEQGLIINISSAASQGPLGGIGVYSMTKAALNMLGICLARDQELPERAVPAEKAGQEGAPATAVKVVSFSPGMVETQMQAHLREQPEELLPNVEFFRDAARSGSVRSQADVGKIIASLNYDTFESGSYHHIQDLI